MGSAVIRPYRSIDRLMGRWRTTSRCRKHKFSATSSAFGLRNAAIVHAIHRITNPSRYYDHSGSVPFHPIKEKLPRSGFCALQPCNRPRHPLNHQSLPLFSIAAGVFHPIRLRRSSPDEVFAPYRLHWSAEHDAKETYADAAFLATRLAEGLSLAAVRSARVRLPVAVWPTSSCSISRNRRWTSASALPVERVPHLDRRHLEGGLAGIILVRQVAGAEYPGNLQVLDVGRRDLGQWRIPLPELSPATTAPIFVRLPSGIL